MNRSLNDRIVVRKHYGGAYTTTQTPANGVSVKDLVSAEILAFVGTLTNVGGSPLQSWTLAIQHSDTINSGFEPVPVEQLAVANGRNDLGEDGVFAVINAADEDDTHYRLGYLGNKAFVRVVATAANTPGSTVIVVQVIGEPALAPGVDA